MNQPNEFDQQMWEDVHQTLENREHTAAAAGHPGRAAGPISGLYELVCLRDRFNGGERTYDLWMLIMAGDA